jgi:hypothetical protein
LLLFFSQLRYLIDVDGGMGNFSIKPSNLRAILRKGDAVLEIQGGEPLSTLCQAASKFMRNAWQESSRLNTPEVRFPSRLDF